MGRYPKDEEKRLAALGEATLKQANEINEMKYTKSRRDKANSIKDKLKEVRIICGAIDRATGKICTKEPAEGGTNGRCKQHGGLSTGPTTDEGLERVKANLNPLAQMVHGLYSRFTMTHEEMEFYVTFMNHYIEELDLDPANVLILDRALRNFILNQRKEIAEAGELLDESQSYNDYDTKFLRYMQSLGLDRKFNVSKEHKDNNSAGDISLLFMDDE